MKVREREKKSGNENGGASQSKEFRAPTTLYLWGGVHEAQRWTVLTGAGLFVTRTSFGGIDKTQC